MTMTITFSRFLDMENIPLVDVRSPGEYEKGHISGAINIPLFSNEQRAHVGTLYKQVSQDAAFKAGLDYVGPKMSELLSSAQELAVNNKIAVYCWRGGSRSGSVAWLWEMAGLEVFRIEGGYKASRHHIRRQFANKARLLVLTGQTGSGKTRLIKELKARGVQTMDLEGLANHMGSSFGYRGDNIQPTNEQFENNLFAVWNKLDLSKPIVMEDESQSIGKVYIVDELYSQIKEAPALYIEIEKEKRVENILEDYKDIDEKHLIHSCERIKKRFGGQRFSHAVELIKNSQYRQAVEVILEYYDSSYERSINRHKRPVTKVDLKCLTISQQAELIRKSI
jgi:tRNA 2-selenouridine synthase